MASSLLPPIHAIIPESNCVIALQNGVFCSLTSALEKKREYPTGSAAPAGAEQRLPGPGRLHGIASAYRYCLRREPQWNRTMMP
jgi:hypothetical protein